MKLLLHTCCAPCLIYPARELKGKGFELAGFFYNPNIHPFLEYKSRKQALMDLGSELDLIIPEYDPKEYFHAVHLREPSPVRCESCWDLRLKKTAQAAKNNGFEYFSTTLLVSPYQDQEKIKNIGGEIGKEVGVDFYYQDFRSGFRSAHEEAKQKGIYCQKYCGCIYSKIERSNSSSKSQILPT